MVHLHHPERDMPKPLINPLSPPRRALRDPRAIAALLARSAHIGRQLVTIETDRRGETVAYLERQPAQAVRS